MDNPTTFAQLGWQSWFTLAVLIAMMVGLVREWLGPDVIVGSALATLLAAGVLNPSEALVGFGNQGLLTIAALFIVAQAVKESGGLATAASRVFGRTQSRTMATLRLMLPTIGVSAFLNNTPVVAMFIPVVRQWAERNDISPSKLLIPLSYASILGGMCTLIGTSTNLVVSGMMTSHGYAPIGMFELSKIGIPFALMGVLFMITAGRRLLPDRRDVTTRLSEASREYLVEMVVREDCPLVGKSIEAGGLRHLKGLFLVHIERNTRIIGPVLPTETLLPEDRLLFTGVVSTIVDLKNIKGLVPSDDLRMDVENPRELRLFEVVVSPSSPLVGVGVRAASFRNRYDAAVIAVHRSGQRIKSKIGDIVMRPGDTLLLEAPNGFARSWYNSEHFYLVSKVGEVKRIKHEKTPFVMAVLAIMVALPVFNILPMVVSAFSAAAVLLLGRAVSPTSARSSIDLSVIVVIGSALGIGKAMEVTGLSSVIASIVVETVSGLGPVAVLGAIMLMTNVFTELLTNKAAAAMLFPVALSAATQMGIDPRPFMIAVTVAAAASFATPLGYQTNLIVYGPGGYRFSDFLRVGSFMNMFAVIFGTLLISFWWGLL